MQDKAGDARAVGRRGGWEAWDHGAVSADSRKGIRPRRTGQRMDRPEKPRVSEMQKKMLGSRGSEDADREAGLPEA